MGSFGADWGQSGATQGQSGATFSQPNFSAFNMLILGKPGTTWGKHGAAWGHSGAETGQIQGRRQFGALPQAPAKIPHHTPTIWQSRMMKLAEISVRFNFFKTDSISSAMRIILCPKVITFPRENSTSIHKENSDESL
ncbi:hypothetical protein [Acaryochloris marina]|uniref:Uncharacterized protein n=1 Tax=Acaryochloris marina (strain MBIC 11017) TaxID=329726 RepID=A8ZPV2_ACAM1|nr:hypothetical protein [Acaryochloris marina]ABW33026.1 hypothetical protein AM1_F0159 [Acaryochloris marina MBIC11017]